MPGPVSSPVSPPAFGASPFHAGERRLQAHVGRAERMEEVGRIVIRDHMPEQHRELYTKLPFMLVGSLDDRQRPWASIVVGRPGFVTAPDARRLGLRGHAAAADPLRAHLRPGVPIGLLGIEPHTRRRNRMNGIVAAVDGLDASGFEVEVRQSFGNCPKYIQPREPRWAADPSSVAEPRAVVEEGAALSAPARSLIESADTFFIASSSAAAAQVDGAAGEGVDVSHRGGMPGFVRVEAGAAGTVLTVPDYVGNSMFNTLGNLLVHPWAGLLFVDFMRGDLLWLQARADVLLDAPETAGFAGAERLLRLQVMGGRRVAAALPMRWDAPAAAASPSL